MGVLVGRRVTKCIRGGKKMGYELDMKERRNNPIIFPQSAETYVLRTSLRFR